jgi:hypothetical protein
VEEVRRRGSVATRAEVLRTARDAIEARLGQLADAAELRA